MNQQNNPNTGYVYFITDPFNIKIGYTKNNPNKRLKQLNTGSPNQLYLLGYIKGTKKDEDRLHKTFNEFKIRNNGEWFQSDETLISYINQVNEIPGRYVYKDNKLFGNKIMILDKIELVT